MSIRATGRLVLSVVLTNVEEFSLLNDRRTTRQGDMAQLPANHNEDHVIAIAEGEEFYNMVEFKDAKGRVFRSFVRVGTGFQQEIQEKAVGDKFKLYCIPTDGQHRNNQLKTREHDGVKYVKVERCQLTPFAGRSQREVDAAREAKRRARLAKLGL